MLGVKLTGALPLLAIVLVLSCSAQCEAFSIQEVWKFWTSPSKASRKQQTSVSVPRSFCIPSVSQVLEDHEERHECAYDSPLGYRAVGVGYNLDSDVDQRKMELSSVLADYDKVYDGDKCLNTLQINALLALDAKRALDKAASVAKALDGWCCDVQAVFADIAFTAGSKKELKEEEFKRLVEKASALKWTAAADMLEEGEWCEDNKKRCRDDAAHLRKGCDSWLGSLKSAWKDVSTPRSLCIRTVSTVMEKYEGRHKCAYDSDDGYRAIGVGYNLDDDREQRAKEISGIVANYEKVYKGDQCLNNIQISALLALDAKRYLDRAAEEMKKFDDLCCPVQAVFADLDFIGGRKLLGSDDMQEVVDKALDGKYKKAADALLDSEWCKDEEERCKDHEATLRIGCGPELKERIKMFGQ